MASDNMDSNKEEYANNSFQKHIDTIQASCNNIQNEERKKECNRFKKSFNKAFIAKGSNLNQQLAKIPKETDILYLFVDKISTLVDFNNLESHMTVIISSFNFEDNYLYHIVKNIKKVIFDSKYHNYLKLTDNISLKEEPEATITILGNMKSKVTHLTICSLKVNFEGEINCQNLFLRNSIFISQSSSFIEKLDVEYLIEDINSYSYNIENTYFVKQYSVYYEFQNVDDVQTVLLENDFYGTTLYIEGISISYDNKDEIGLIFTASSIDISIKGNDFDKQYIVNMTLIEDLIDFDLPTYQETKIVSISSSGDTEFIDNAPIFHITYDKNQIELDKKNLNIELLEHQIYSYKSKDDSEYDDDDIIEESNDSVDDYFSSDAEGSGDIEYDSIDFPDDEGNDSSSDDSESTKPSSTSQNKNKNFGMIIGIVLGCVGVIVILFIVIFIIIRKRKMEFYSSTQMSE
ncbi:hypothetical protein M9Y10_020502 [Tritrichomonas musculus]|uniref:Uncharacterized protein n=1 Tax=Tritrichomonas musculus TaxID=1915356 RepID=A0ABR2HIE1_9EUKA